VTHYAAYPDERLTRGRKRRTPPGRSSAVAWLLRGSTTCLVLAGGLMLTNLVLQWTHGLDEMAGHDTDPTPITLFIADQRLAVPANMFRFPEQRGVGPHQRIDLVVHWPEMAGYAPAYKNDYLDTSANAPLVFVTIKKRDTLTDSTGRLINVYQHFFEDSPIAAPDGLIGHRMSEESGLGGEEVFFEAGSTEPFTTHCTAVDNPGFPATCMTEIHAGRDLSVQLRFRKGMLTNWAGIKSGVRVLLLSFGITS
jgi:hypothetical protein